MGRTDELRRAVELAIEGSWVEAHLIAQRHEGDMAADWLHAIVHKIEGDMGNSRYWYRRCGMLDRANDNATVELHELKAALID